MVAGSACQVFQGGGGIGMARLVTWPPRNRTCRWMRSVLVMVTSSMSRRAMRLRCGLRGPTSVEEEHPVLAEVYRTATNTNSRPDHGWNG